MLHSPENEQALFGVGYERLDPALTVDHEARDRVRAGVAYRQAHDLGRRSVQETQLSKVVVLRHDHEVVVAGVRPYLGIGLPVQAERVDVRAARKIPGKLLDQPRTEILVEQQLHAAVGPARRRSRAAAKARHARMCSGFKLGKSVSICCSVIPPARYSRTS